MSRIPDEDIDRIKKSTNLTTIIQARGIKLKQQGANWTGFCPFHKDAKTPNLIVTPGKGLFRCMASCCGKAGNVIQFVEWHDGVSFRHAFELLNGGEADASHDQLKTSTVPKLPSPVDTEQTDDEVLERVSNYYHSRLKSTDGQAVLDYLKARGIDNFEMVKHFKVGVSDRTLGLRIPHRNRAAGEIIRKQLGKLGVFRKSGHEHLVGCLTVPVMNVKNEVKQIYGRRLGKVPKNERHWYLAKPLEGFFNPEALNNKEIILTESILDALTFWHHGMKNVTCTFGTANFKDELFDAIKAHGIESVRLAYDADKSGEDATEKALQRLQKFGVACYKVQFPQGFDANEYAKDQGGEALKKVVREALFLGVESSTCAPLLSNNKAANSLVAEPLALEVAKEKKVSEASGGGACELGKNGDYYTLTVADRAYRVGGLHKNNSLEVLRITLRVSYDNMMHVDSMDLYRDGERRKFVDRASEETMLDKDTIKRDLSKLLLALEQAQEERLNGDAEEADICPLTEEEEAEAREFLQSPNLLGKIAEAYDSSGLVGEATNKLAAYLACVSRKLAKPLAVIIQSTSAAGKSTLMDAVLSFFPKDELVKYSAMTGQSLYYLGESNLKHKILAIVEEEGAEKASYALKLLQSEGELTIASTGKDATTGRMQTEEYHVEGPVAIVFTTTSIDIDEELMNRCLVLTVDESREQTEKIHELQRLARTPEGILAAEKRKDVQKLMQNAQRLILPMKIANPYARFLTFTSGRTRTRRDHEKYLTLIDTIALLHQHQRETTTHKIGDKSIEMLPVTLDDIEAANRIAPEVLGRSLDELPPQTRRLLEDIQRLVKSKMEATQGLEQQVCFFSRKELRDLSGWSQTQIHRHLDCLVDLEYVRQKGGKNGVRMQYELLADLHEKNTYTIGLLDMEKLRAKERKKKSA